MSRTRRTERRRAKLNKPMDLLGFDWDDSELIKAYNMQNSEGEDAPTKLERLSKEIAKGKKTKKSWKLGDYCRALYKEDGLQYEATIVDIQGNICTIEFLGYGNYEDVPLDTVEESLGKKARQKQRKSVKKAQLSMCTSDTDYSCMNDITNVNKDVKSGHAPNGDTTVDYSNAYAAGYSEHHTQAQLQQHSAPPQLTFNHAMHAPVSAPVQNSFPLQRMGGAAHCLPPPPPPPMPPCSSTANDPALTAMLVSWYMAGYYTGLHQNRKSSHCHSIPKTHCCEHQIPNSCGHFF